MTDSQGQKLKDRLESVRAELLALVQGLDEADVGQQTANPGWTVQDVVAHLASAERGHVQVVRALLDDQGLESASFDLDAFNEREVAARRNRSLADLLEELADGRRETLALLDRLGSADWDRAGHHPGGFDTTVEGVFRVIAIHEKRHLKDIKAALAV